MNKKPLIWLIAGTSEGRKLIKALEASNVDIIASVATEYGASLIEPQHNLKVIAERMDLAEMMNFIQNNKPDCVIDATHPYAVVVTKTIKEACDATNSQYLRYLRQESSTDDCIQLDSYQEAVEFLNHVDGNKLNNNVLLNLSGLFLITCAFVLVSCFRRRSKIWLSK